MVTTREYCVIEDGEGEQPFVGFDDMLEDYYVGVGTEEQEYDQFEGRSNFGTEETRGEEEGYFDMSEDNYVGPDNQETVEEEEVDNLTTQDLFTTEDSETCQSVGREEDGDRGDDSIEEENSHRLDQPLENIYQSENYNYEWSPSDDEYGYEYQPSDDEYGHEYQPFSTLADTYVVTVRMGPDTQETIEEEVGNLTTHDFFITEDSETFQRGGREEDGDQEDNNIEEENSHRLDQQPLENIDQSENYNYEWSPSDDEYGYEYQPSDDEYGQEYQPFSTLADTMVVTVRIGEIGGGEEEEEEDDDDDESFVDFYQFEDTPVHTAAEEEEEAEAEEEKAEAEANEAELAEIEDLLWRFIKLENFSRVDPDRLRDCRGLKRLKEAMEIIKKDIYNKDKETDQCSLCLEGLAEGEEEVARTRCSHLFHRKCLCSWLSIKDSCPLCRSRCATVV